MKPKHETLGKAAVDLHKCECIIHVQGIRDLSFLVTPSGSSVTTRSHLPWIHKVRDSNPGCGRAYLFSCLHVRPEHVPVSSTIKTCKIG